MTASPYKYLYQVDSPRDLRRLSPDELRAYCGELRHFIIEQLSANPGHLGSSLGVVELAAALHYVFDTPNDKLIWDVGHQAYAHKIITGRRDRFLTNRKLNGLSGFPSMSESEYDAFGTGHASTSISAALGMAAASALRGEKREVIAVIGDGALTGGLAFEGLNNAGAANTDLLVILNDNRMAIDPNVGALKEYLLSISTSKRYNKVKNRTWTHLERMPRLRGLIQKVGGALKQGFLQQSNLFESLHFRYFGPVDGHDVVQLTRVLGDLKEIPGPKLLHVLTVKGKGGRVRSVPVTAAAAKQALRDRKAAVRRGHKLFVPDDVATDAYIHAFQAFLREHRPDQGTNPRPLTHHGMRHSYAARQYREALDGGATEYRAKLEVSKLLGHGRADVTDVYLASRKA